jgi:sporulation protein YlmC with PRC-barrel domain
MTMLSKFLAAAALGSALIAAPALAQDKMSPAPSAKTTNAQTASASGMWQGSKLINMNVYNDQNEKIGTIKELLVDKSGHIDTVALAVGGFLGIGERDVAVKFADLKWSNEPVKSASSSSTTSNRPATSGSASTNSSSGPRTYPDHAVFNASKDQLKAMPQFDYNK